MKYLAAQDKVCSETGKQKFEVCSEKVTMKWECVGTHTASGPEEEPGDKPQFMEASTGCSEPGWS